MILMIELICLTKGSGERRKSFARLLEQGGCGGGEGEQCGSAALWRLCWWRCC